MRNIIVVSLVTLLAGCNATTSDSSPGNTALHSPQESSGLASLNRFPPKYPEKEAMNGKEGCATIEYTVGSDRKVSDINVIEASDAVFAAEARKVVSRWSWQTVSEDAFPSPVKFQTRFEYCLEEGNGNCLASALAARTQCSGDDMIASVGMKIK